MKVAGGQAAAHVEGDVFPAGDDVWLTGVGRHWFIDGAGTRSS